MITNKFCIYRKANDVIQFLLYNISNGGSIFTNFVPPSLVNKNHQINRGIHLPLFLIVDDISSFSRHYLNSFKVGC